MKYLIIGFGILFSTLFILPISVDAKNWYVYVDKMPVKWQQQYGNLMYDATKYWENKMLGTKFYETTNREKADFVVQWASQYQGTKLGYYTPSTDNDYGRPYIAITLGFMDDESVPFQQRKFNLVHQDYALEITKHEIGHAIGLGHSTDPNNIMYPSIYNYGDWLMMRNQGSSSNTIFPSKSSQIISQLEVEIKKSHYENVIEELESGIITAENSLENLYLESKDAQKKLELAWEVRWTAKEHLNTAENALGAGLYEVEKSDYQKALNFFSKIDSESSSIGANLITISNIIDDALQLEKEFQSTKESQEKESEKQEKKTCFLFWCW